MTIALRWACDHPGSARPLAISDGGLFSDRRWHDLANVMLWEDAGERAAQRLVEFLRVRG